MATESDKPAVRAWPIIGILLAAAGLAGFYGINKYTDGTGAIVSNANRNHQRFEMVFKLLVEARYRALNLASETLLQSRVTVEAFGKDQRADLVARMEPYFATLNKTHGIEQLNFWLPPATMYYRAGSPNSFGQDLSGYRKSIVAANERRAAVSAIESGMGGLIGIRSIAPVMLADKYVGAIEFVSNFNIPLERASDISGLKWATSLMKETSERVARNVDLKSDAWQGNDVYYRFSDTNTAETVKAIKFDPRSKEHAIVNDKGRIVYVKAFPVLNFSGVPTITVATLLDVSAGYAAERQSAIISSFVIFLLLSIAGCLAFFKAGSILRSMSDTLNRQKKEHDQFIERYESLLANSRKVELIKRGFFTNLVTAINEPLQAVSGTLRSVSTKIEAASPSPDVSDRLHFAVSETARLSGLISDYQQIELFRQKLVKSDSPLTTLSGAVDRALSEDLAQYSRLPQLKISMVVPAGLPDARIDPDFLRRAIVALVSYAARGAGSGTIALEGELTASGWLRLAITGTAYAKTGAPTEAMLDESRQFIARLATEHAIADAGATLIPVVLARMIVEFYGGSVEASTGAKQDPGFVILLPVAA